MAKAPAGKGGGGKKGGAKPAGKGGGASQMQAPGKTKVQGGASIKGEGPQFLPSEAGVRFRARMKEVVIPTMLQEFGWTNIHQVPAVEKVVINIGLGEGSKDLKLIEAAMEDLAAITGQRPVITRARKSVAAYKIRTGMPIGTMVTLRGGRMYDFLDKLFNIALPRVRDFQGLNANAFDTRGNYTLGIREQLVFPEIDYDKVSRVRGMDITIVTTAQDDVAARRLLELLGLPLRKPRAAKSAAAQAA